ncbi:hypothetical protein DDZ14_15655 [Maritimibacter sp. 55A14]|uniref:hypothetical protein n=1 Tax=Maritimibacter sp. 55A14 TaxID=2174844 RepID=UPI000D61B550|nr:hypothetical protein [Maritimibacter sp. 55A14]PWE30474.1 hypothetical protein DDZ14_15655 [Maritimibacter sp. 55A14]
MKPRSILFHVGAPALLAFIYDAPPAAAQVFELIHPEVERGSFELEILSGARLDSVPAGDERGALELALAYAPTQFWKTTIAVELADPQGGGLEVEAAEWENLLLLTAPEHDDDHDHGAAAQGFRLTAAALYSVLEIPAEGGINDGAFAFGPAVEFAAGRATVIGNLLAEIPFTDGDNAALLYALGLSVPAGETFALGIEAHGEIEDAFDGGEFGDGEHLLGPAIYAEYDIGRGREIEPRLALLAGLNDESPDAVLSLNIEMGF